MTQNNQNLSLANLPNSIKECYKKVEQMISESLNLEEYPRVVNIIKVALKSASISYGVSAIINLIRALIS